MGSSSTGFYKNIFTVRLEKQLNVVLGAHEDICFTITYDTLKFKYKTSVINISIPSEIGENRILINNI